MLAFNALSRGPTHFAAWAGVTLTWATPLFSMGRRHPRVGHPPLRIEFAFNMRLIRV